MKFNEIYNLLPEEGQDYFEEVYNSSLRNGRSPVFAEAVATEMVKSKLTLVEGKLVAMSNSFKPTKLYSFNLNNVDSRIIMNSENEEFVMEAVLANTEKNTENKYFTVEELNDISNQINLLGSTLPDVDHEKLNALVAKYGNDYEKIRKELVSEKGIFKTIKSMVKDGKLWIQAQLDKRYKNHADKFSKLSIEALADSDKKGRLHNPKYLGFTFTNTPKLEGAEIVKVY
jgi:hypothetical protein